MRVGPKPNSPSNVLSLSSSSAPESITAWTAGKRSGVIACIMIAP